MKNKVIWLGLSFLIVAVMVLSSCAASGTSTSTGTATSIPVSTVTTSTSVSTTTTNTGTVTITTATTTTSTGNWWDSLGTPQYGDTMILRIPSDIMAFDPYVGGGQTSIYSCWIENLFSYDWTIDPTVFNFQLAFTPPEYASGQLAQSYTFTDPQTVSVTLRQNIYWQNIAPANGRQFVADDVAYKFNRLYGLGGYGFTTPGNSSVTSAVKVFLKLKSVTAPSKYTVVFSFTGANPEDILEGITGPNIPKIECPDQVKQDGDANNWHHVIGTGPFMLTDYVSGSSATLVKNPNYWGYDERYSQNKLPYVDRVIYLIIPNTTTALASLRTGKIEVLDGLSYQNSIDLKKTNPELNQLKQVTTEGSSVTLDPRNDRAPFSDIRVREAMQMAIDLPTINTSLYDGNAYPYPQALTSAFLYPAWGWPYSQWPQSLKDEYAYNPTQAKALLAAAGYTNGFNTNVVVANNNGNLDLLFVIQSYLAAVNINMSISTMDYASCLNVLFSHNVPSLDFWRSAGNTYSPMLSIQSYLTGMLFNWKMYSNPTYDALVNNALSPTTSIDEIKQDLIKADQIVAEGHIVISLCDPPSYGISQPWLHGYNAQFNAISGNSTAGGSPYFFLARYWIDKN